MLVNIAVYCDYPGKCAKCVIFVLKNYVSGGNFSNKQWPMGLWALLCFELNTWACSGFVLYFGEMQRGCRRGATDGHII